jgi:hypothetical protein
MKTSDIIKSSIIVSFLGSGMLASIGYLMFHSLIWSLITFVLVAIGGLVYFRVRYYHLYQNKDGESILKWFI